MQVNTLILGAGAAGLMCAANAGPNTLIIDHAKKAGEKIRISGGGRCNFTNMYCDAGNFISENKHFAKSALKRYTQWDFVDLIAEHGIAYHEKTLGQLFCDGKATQIVDMFHGLLTQAGAQLWLQTTLVELTYDGSRFTAALERAGQRTAVTASNVVVATGGKSIPNMGASGIAYDIAKQFGHTLTDTRPALVPFTFSDAPFAPMSGTALPTRATAGGVSFDEATLFTHRGLSGPAMLQISSYWHEGEAITLNLDPDNSLLEALRKQRQTAGRKQLTTELSRLLPGKLVDHLTHELALTGNLADQSDARLGEISSALQTWHLKPSGTEGYRTAEVTVGGVDTSKLNSQSMMSTHQQGLYFIGECVDVTGWLGGFNFQWAWASGMAAAQHIVALK